MPTVESELKNLLKLARHEQFSCFLGIRACRDAASWRLQP